MDEDRGLRLVPLGLALEVLEGHAEIIAAAVDELHVGAGADRGQRARHEGVRRAEDRLALDARELERGERAARPAREADRFEAVPFRPGLLEGGQLLALRPLLGIEDLGPQLEEAGTVAVVETDRELGHVGQGCLGGAYGWLLLEWYWERVRRESDQLVAEGRRKASSEIGRERLNDVPSGETRAHEVADIP